MVDWSALHDYSSSRAVLMGTWNYKFLEPVPPAENSLQRMRRMLSGRLCGWPQERLLILGDEPGPGDLSDRIITAFEGIRDVALFYYVGHGQIAHDNQLCLGLVHSRPEASRRAATSLRFSDVRQALLDSGAAVKIVILDCCFAGLATTGTLAPRAGDVLDMTAGTGAYTMAATSAYGTAWYENDAGRTRPQTYFTKYLVDLIMRGMPGAPARLQLERIYRQLHENLAIDKRPIPNKRTVNDARDFVFAYNAAPKQAHRDPESELSRLTQRLAESKSIIQKADAQIAALKVELAQHTKELALLKKELASHPPSTPEGQHELQVAIDNVARHLDATIEAQEAIKDAVELVELTRETPCRALLAQLAGSMKTPLVSASSVLRAPLVSAASTFNAPLATAASALRGPLANAVSTFNAPSANITSTLRAPLVQMAQLADALRAKRETVCEDETIHRVL